MHFRQANDILAIGAPGLESSYLPQLAISDFGQCRPGLHKRAEPTFHNLMEPLELSSYSGLSDGSIEPVWVQPGCVDIAAVFFTHSRPATEGIGKLAAHFATDL